MYEVRFHRAVKGDLRRMDKSAVEEFRKEHLPRLKENPHLAKPLTGLRDYPLIISDIKG